MSIRLYVGNLPKEVIEKDVLQNLFADEANTISTKVIKDRKTGKCRGFAFVTVPTDEVADEFIAKFNGQSFMDSELKIEKALPREKSKGKEEEEGSQEETVVKVVTPPNTSAKRQKTKRTPKKSGATNTQSSPSSDAAQPDPRWAAQLAELKERLQAVNS
jgi:RNA recognition motif-containing protein